MDSIIFSRKTWGWAEEVVNTSLEVSAFSIVPFELKRLAKIECPCRSMTLIFKFTSNYTKSIPLKNFDQSYEQSALLT